MLKYLTPKRNQAFAGKQRVGCYGFYNRGADNERIPCKYGPKGLSILDFGVKTARHNTPFALALP